CGTTSEPLPQQNWPFFLSNVHAGIRQRTDTQYRTPSTISPSSERELPGCHCLAEHTKAEDIRAFCRNCPIPPLELRYLPPSSSIILVISGAESVRVVLPRPLSRIKE